MSSTAASGFVFLLLSVQVIQSQDTWGVTYTPTDVCGVKGSIVSMTCRYTYPSRIKNHDIRKTFWFTKEKDGEPVDLMSDSEYSGRVKYKCCVQRCTLIISDLRESDSAEYKFMFTTSKDKHTDSPGVTLYLTDPSLQVKVSRLDSTRVGLKCLSGTVLPDRPSYIWYENGEKIKTGPSYSVSFGSSNSYYCAVKGPKNICSPSVHAPMFASVSVSPSNIVEGSSVTLTCSSDANPAANYTWHKRNQPLLSKGPQLVISSFQASDSGQFYCGAENQLGKRRFEFIVIDVKYPPRRPVVLVTPTGEIVEGSSVTLTCSSHANPAASYTWYKEKQKLPQVIEGVHRFTYISSKDSGIYYCKSKNKHGEIMSPSLLLNVQYAPRLPSVSVSPSKIVEGSSVTLTCSSDANPAASYTWYKEKQKLIQGPKGVHRFTSISSKDSGNYYCKSENKHGSITSSPLVIDVLYGPKRPSVSVSPSAQMMEGSSVTLTCSSDAKLAASYTWYKGKKKLLQGPEGVYHFTSISSKDSGIYYCKSENKHGSITYSSLVINVLYPPRRPSVSVNPSDEIVKGSSVTLTCSSDANPPASYTWYKVDEDSPKASGRIFIITDFTDEHSGNYYCEAQNTIGRSNSTFHLSLAAFLDTTAMMLNNINSAGVVVVLIYLLILFLWMRMKKALISTTEPYESIELDVFHVYENISDEEEEDTEYQED